MAKSRLANKLLLLDDVEGLGRRGDVVSVRPGFARNYLLPQKIAVIANPHALRMQARLQEERAQQAIVDKKEAEELAVRLEGLLINQTVKVDQEGHMYGSVTALDVVHLIKEQANIELEKRYVQLHHPIKEVGVHTIKLKLKENVPCTITLKVVPEGAQE